MRCVSIELALAAHRAHIGELRSWSLPCEEAEAKFTDEIGTRCRKSVTLSSNTRWRAKFSTYHTLF